jgi:hypothetical protein
MRDKQAHDVAGGAGGAQTEQRHKFSLIKQPKDHGPHLGPLLQLQHGRARLSASELAEQAAGEMLLSR